MSDSDLKFELQKAITENQLVLHYQPRIVIETRVMRGVEALVRWRHPSRGLVAPAELIAAAERAGLMRDLETWVIHEALLQASVWRRDGLRAGVSVNSSPALLRDEAFLRLFDRTLKIQGDPTTLIVEVAAANLGADRPVEGLARLRERGVRLALDDVTEPAQLDAAAWTRWDYVKLGRAVVGPAAKDAASGERLRRLTDRTAGLGVRVVAMGVEDDATLALLREAGVFMAQGYAISPPLGVKELSEWVAGRGRPV